MKRDGLWRCVLTVSRDVYHRHPDALTADEWRAMPDLIALAWYEGEQLEKATKGADR